VPSAAADPLGLLADDGEDPAIAWSRRDGGEHLVQCLGQAGRTGDALPGWQPAGALGGPGAAGPRTRLRQRNLIRAGRTRPGGTVNYQERQRASVTAWPMTAHSRAPAPRRQDIRPCPHRDPTGIRIHVDRPSGAGGGRPGDADLAGLTGLGAGKAARAPKIWHLPDATAAGLRRVWYLTATACPAEPGAFVVQAGPRRDTAVTFRGNPGRYVVNEAKADRHR
jgi:hypothetical protein